MSRTMTTTTPLAVAADYADALMTARRAKFWLFLILALLILSQIAVFVLAKYDVVRLNEPAAASGSVATTLPSTAELASATRPADVVAAAKGVEIAQVVRYATPVVNFLATVFSVLLGVVLLLLVTIMLVGRLIGVSHVTSAFIWSALFVLVLFPWQTFLIGSDEYRVSAGGSVLPDQPSFKWPGALYTWGELKQEYQTWNDLKATGKSAAEAVPGANPMLAQVWMWGRFVGLPTLALLLLLIVQAKSARGLRFALGESEVHVEVTTRPDGSIV